MSNTTSKSNKAAPRPSAKTPPPAVDQGPASPGLGPSGVWGADDQIDIDAEVTTPAPPNS